MAYIGKQPVVGNFQVCDAISVVNGQAAYTMQVASANVNPENANHMLVSLNGVLQKPGSSFTISGATITFASNLATGDVIDFIILLGNVLDIGTPSDGTVTTAKLADDAVTAAKATGFGKIAQVISTVKTDTFTSTSGSLTDITGMSAAITPSATSSKVLVKVVMHVGMTAADRYSVFQLVRGSTAISLGAASSSRSNASFAHVRVDANGSANEVETKTITFLDSPSTTSATTYKMQGLTQTDSSPSFTVNRSGGDADAAHGFRVASSITLMEVLA
jgi:hypothetical protein